MDDLRSGELVEELAVQVLTVPDPARPIAQLCGLPFGERDQLFGVARRNLGMHAQHVGDLGAERDRLQVLQGVVLHLPEQMRADGDLPGRGHEERVPVGSCRGRRVGADHAVRPGLILDHERLAQQRPDVLAEVPREHVHAAAGGMRQITRIGRARGASPARKSGRPRRRGR
jgi:hypothetical protein